MKPEQNKDGEYRLMGILGSRQPENRTANLRSSCADTMKWEIYKEEGYRLMGAAFDVYNEQGFGLGEEIYQESLELELELRKIPFRPKQELRCFYKGRPLLKRYVPDLFVFDCLVVELKALTALAPDHEAQLINYLRITRQPVGYLVNFGHKDSLEWKRIILSEFIAAPDPSASISGN